MEESTGSQPGLLKRACFFFLFTYFLLTNSPLPLDDLYVFLGRVFFGIGNLDAQFNGSGDKTYHYLQTFTNLLLSLPLSFILLFTIRKPKVIGILSQLFYIFIRYYLAFTMLGYGFLKVMYQQFVPPSLFTLDQKVGNLSPMALAWTYMGYSHAYTVFSGLAEMIGGILLLFRSTSLLGAIVVFAVMFNVMMMNFCYDIPVKIFSTHLVFWSLVLMFGFDKRLLNFILQRHSEPNAIEKYFKNRTLNIAHYCVKAVALVFIIFTLYSYTAYIDNGSRPLRGIYNTETWVWNNRAVERTDSAFWYKLIVDGKDFASFKKEHGGNIRMEFIVDTIGGKIKITAYGEKERKGTLSYQLADSILTLKGNIGPDTLYARLRQFDHRKFILTSRGFHWVNEFPYNK